MNQTMNAFTIPQKLQSCLEGLAEQHGRGRQDVRAELIRLCNEQIHRRAQAMLQDYPRLRRWEDSEDVAQEACLRLLRSLEQLAPRTVRELEGLIQLQLRRTLIDLSRRHGGRKGKRWTIVDSQVIPERAEEGEDPRSLALWTEFHEHVWHLPARHREAFILLWYEGLSQEQAAEVFHVDPSTVKRWWRSARDKLAPVVPATALETFELYCAV